MKILQVYIGLRFSGRGSYVEFGCRVWLALSPTRARRVVLLGVTVEVVVVIVVAVAVAAAAAEECSD